MRRLLVLSLLSCCACAGSASPISPTVHTVTVDPTLPTTTASAVISSAAQLAGSWSNIDPNTRGLTHATITAQSGMLSVHMWGACSPIDCDWGTASIPVSNVVGSSSFPLVWIFTNGITSNDTVTFLINGQLSVASHDTAAWLDVSYTSVFAPN